MSNSALIEIKLAKLGTNRISPTEVVQRLLNYGWTLNDNERITYLPLGDADDFNWQTESIGMDSVLKIISEKEKRNEIIGLVLTWMDTSIGGNVLIWNDGNISFDLNINRKFVDDVETIKITDVNWYITKLLPSINKDGLQVESFKFKEHI